MPFPTAKVFPNRSDFIVPPFNWGPTYNWALPNRLDHIIKTIPVKPFEFKLEPANTGWSYKTGSHENRSMIRQSLNSFQSFSYVVSERLFAQVNCLPTIEISLKSKLSMTALNKNGQ
jgi:hypothetical protein